MGDEIVVKADDAALAPVNEAALRAEQAQRQVLSKYVASCMVEGQDYGEIPGTRGSKSLWKAGAEKLCGLFKCRAEFELVHREEDKDTGLWVYDFRCEIHTVSGGLKVAEGFGSASSFEKKWRTSTVYVHGLKQSQDKSAMDMWDVRNTVLKMAKKRSLVDAAILLGRCSDIFTQDWEDMPEEDKSQGGPQRPRPAVRKTGGKQLEWSPKFGRAKGKDVAAMTSEELVHWDAELTKLIADPNNQYRKINEYGHRAVQQELQRRLDAEAASAANSEPVDPDTGEVADQPYAEESSQ